MSDRAGRPVWSDDVESLALPTLGDDVAADVCVVGLGGSGLTCVNALVAAGARVVGLDAGDLGGGAAGRNGGFLLGGIAAFHHDAIARHGRERAVRAYRLTLDEIARMAAETPAAVRLVGSLRIAVDAGELADCERQRAAMIADGLPVERYEGPEGEGILFPRDGVFHPLRRCRSLARAARDAGARLYAHSPVEGIAPGAVETPNGRVHAATILALVDGRLERLFPQLHGRVRSARLQMLATEPARDVRYPRPVYTRYGLDYWQQLPDGRIALGGFRDVGGDEEWTAIAEPTRRVQAALDRCLRETVGTAASVTHRWAAVVGYNETGFPVVEEVERGVWAAGAYCGTGNVIGSLCGRALAEQTIRGATALLP